MDFSPATIFSHWVELPDNCARLRDYQDHHVLVMRDDIQTWCLVNGDGEFSVAVNGEAIGRLAMVATFSDENDAALFKLFWR